MKILKKIRRNNRDLVLVKIYPNYIMYEDKKTKTKECFLLHDLGLIYEKYRRTKKVNPEVSLFSKRRYR